MMRIAIADDLSADAGKLREFICRGLSWFRPRQFLKAAKPCLQALPRIPLM